MSDGTPRSRVRIDGAVDLHCHFGPEPAVERVTGQASALTPAAAVEEAAAAGQRAVVLKPHEFPTTLVAQALDRRHGGVRVLAGITCDPPVGGTNPAAVHTALAAGARVVWLPTLGARGAPADKRRLAFGEVPEVAVLDERGALTDQVRDIADLVIAHGAVLATGHVGRAEHFEIARLMHGRGRLVVTHALQEGAGPDLDIEDCVELTRLGAFLEFTAHTCHGRPAVTDRVLQIVRRVGIEHCVLSSDLGWSGALPDPAAGLADHITALSAVGASADELEQMAGSTPARLLGLEE